MRVATDEATRRRLADRLRSRRRQMGLKQDEMALKIGIKYVTYQRWEQGKVFPDIQNLRKAQEAMGIDLTDLAAGQLNEDGHFLKEALAPLEQEIARLRGELEAMREDTRRRSGH